jgi:hypothetical protein
MKILDSRSGVSRHLHASSRNRSDDEASIYEDAILVASTETGISIASLKFNTSVRSN